ncbi:MAG TPA: polyribonucleotide nucleotidyltransferase, partial [Candidatus Omnitrophica bacterium]|nr:polyribonucleotide nucleotidyltransferase [Candidatus Omnitrophota bacterium]
MKKEVRLKFGAEDIIISFGEIARQANGSVVVQMGETSVLVSAVMAQEPREGIDFLPLTVEYRERAYAGGKIPGGFFKREGRPTEKEILTARLIDRPLRPLFFECLRNEVQITALVLSSDGKYDPDILSVIGASAALSISDIPWGGPIGCVRVAMVDNDFILNPSYQQSDKATLNLVVVGLDDKIVMLEGEAKEVTEDDFSRAVDFAHQNIIASIRIQQELAALCKNEKQNVKLAVLDEKIYSEIQDNSSKIIDKIILIKDRKERSSRMLQLKEDLLKKYEQSCSAEDINKALYKIQKGSVRRYLLENKKRIDGRGFEDIREIDCAVSVLPRTHGSALFTRGQTQSLAVTTLGTSSDEQTVESYEGEMSKKFMLHYNFPPFSVGETGPPRGPGRREIGHGALAEKALSAVMPQEGEFPYT